MPTSSSQRESAEPLQAAPTALYATSLLNVHSTRKYAQTCPGRKDSAESAATVTRDGSHSPFESTTSSPARVAMAVSTSTATRFDTA